MQPHSQDDFTPEEISNPDKNNLTVVDEQNQPVNPADFRSKINIPKDEQAMLDVVKARFEAMDKKKNQVLGIDARCDRFDRLYTPHELGTLALNDRKFSGDALGALVNVDENEDRRARHSKPMAYEKVQTGLGLMIKNNPRVQLEPAKKKFKAFSEVIKQTYYKNIEVNRSILEWKRFAFYMAKYGFGTGRRAYERIFKIEHRDVWDAKDKKMKRIKVRVSKLDDTTFKAVHPKNCWMDENASNARNARDCFFIYQFRESEILDILPENLFPKVKAAKQNPTQWLLKNNITKAVDSSGQPENIDSDDKLHELAYYENEAKDILFTILNGRIVVDLDNELPGHQLSLISEKWSEKDESYDGIGPCHIMEIYGPLVDDINTASVDLVRKRLKPDILMGAGVTISDESEEVDDDRLGAVIHFEGDISQVKWDRPLGLTQGEVSMFDSLLRDVDDATGIVKDLSSASDAGTLGQAAYNRENSLRRLNAPLDALKEAMEDDANKAFKLFDFVYSTPISTYAIDDPKELAQATAALQYELDNNFDSQRFVKTRDGKILRREYRQFDIKLKKDEAGNAVTSQTANFWELIPETWSWRGYIRVIPMSFLPKSQALEDMRTKERMSMLMNLPSMDQLTGKPTMVDENGVAWKVNRKRLVSDYIEQQSLDVDDYVIPFDPAQNQESPASGMTPPDQGASQDGSRNGNANPMTQMTRGAMKGQRAQIQNQPQAAMAGA